MCISAAKSGHTPRGLQGYLTSSEESITALHWVQLSSLPLAGFTTVMIVIIMIAQVSIQGARDLRSKLQFRRPVAAAMVCR